jgi:antitoxin FitA
VRAARNGRSMEEEARLLLSEALEKERKAVPGNLADKIRGLFEPLGGIELELPPREMVGEPIKFE